MLQQPTLVLNRSWVAISTTTVRTALSLVYRNVARVIEPDNYITHDFESWSDLGVSADAPCVRTVRLQLRVPEVILLTQHDRMPRRTVPFSRRNLYRRDGNRCQYCGKRYPTPDLSIDHVIPKSRSGRTSWENCVLACIPCNARKGSRSLASVGMKLLKPATQPRWSPCLTIRTGVRRPSWEKFVSEQYWNVALEED